MSKRPSYKEWIESMNLNPSDYSLDVQNEMINSYMNLYNTDEGLGYLDFLNGKNIGDYVGATGVAAGLIDNHFGMGKDIRKAELKGLNKNIELMDQKIASNKQAMADRKQFNETWTNANKNSFSGQGSGLGQIVVG